MHRVMVYPDRAAGEWSIPIASNPYMADDMTGWQASPFAPAWTWRAGGAEVMGRSDLNRAAAVPVPRVAGATAYRVRVVITTSGVGNIFWGLNYGVTPDDAYGGPFWHPDTATNQWSAIADASPGTRTLEATFDPTTIDPRYAYLGPYVGPWGAGLNRVESIELAYLGAPGVDLSCLVDSVSIVHGRDDATGQPEASSATLELSTSVLDPIPADVEVGAVVVVTTETPALVSQRFTGRITDITLGWEDAGEDTPDAGVGQIVCIGLLADLGRRVVGDTPWPKELDGARVARVMTSAGVPLDPAYADPGTVNLLPRDVDSAPALDVAHDAAESAGGMVWQTRAGEVRYADAEHRRGVTPALTLDACDILVTPSWRRAIDGLVNSVSVGYGATPEGGEQPRYVNTDPASIAKYGTYAYTATTALADAEDATEFGELVLVRNNRPVWNMAALPVDTKGLDDQRYEQLLSLDVGSLVTLTGLPAIGTAPTAASLWVEGWKETLTWDAHELELSVTGYCRTVPPPRWDDVNPAWVWGGETLTEQRRNYVTNPSFRSASGVQEIRRNLISNPSAETGIANWAPWLGAGGGVGAMTRETSGGVQGSAFLRTTWTTPPTSGGGIYSSPLVTVTAAWTYTYSAWVRPSVTLNVSPQHQWYLDGTPTTAQSSPGITCPANVWTRVGFTGTVPAGSNQIQCRWYISSGGPLVAGSTFDLDGALLEAGGTVMPYFDGSTAAPGDGTLYQWTGTAHASAATMTLPSLAGYGPFTGYNSPVGGSYGLGGRAATADAGTVLRVHLRNTLANNLLWAFSTSGSYNVTTVEGDRWKASAQVRQVAGPPGQKAYIRLGYYSAANANVGFDSATPPGVTIPTDGSWVTLDMLGSSNPAPATAATVRFLAYASGTLAGDTVFEVRRVLLEKATAAGEAPGAWFDGATADAAGYDYGWTGTPDASESTASTIGSIPGGLNPEWLWDDMACLGPPINIGRWNDQPASLRWDQIPAATTWDAYTGG